MNTAYIEQLIEEGILSGGKALDLGCGKGDASLFMASHGFDVDAVDVENHEISASAVGQPITFITSDIRDFPIKENTYDFIHARNVLPFIGKDETSVLIEKMYKGLAKNGVMFFTLFGVEDAWNGVKKKMSFFNDEEVKELTKALPVFFKTIKIGQGKAMDGTWKKWHIYTFVCVKGAIL